MHQDKQEKPWQKYQQHSQGIVELRDVWNVREMVALPKMAH